MSSLRSRNNLKRDPTRTGLVQIRFINDMTERYAKLTVEVVNFFTVTDALGLKDRQSLVTLAQPNPREFEFRTDPGKLQAFNIWFEDQMALYLLSPSEVDPWVSKYIEDAYRIGMLNAYLSAKRDALLDDNVADMTREAFLSSSFGAPESINKVKLLATRAFESLKGITGPMGAELNRILAGAMVSGQSVAQIAREMKEAIGISHKRALMLARTETVHAHAEGQLDSFDQLGIGEVGVLAEWSTAGDDKVCPRCSALEGATFSVEEARGMIPLHPNCRCAWIPKV